MANKKVFVSGCFDFLHSGHIAFLQTAAEYGDLTVALGSDRTLFDLKGRPPVNSETERLYMIQSLGCVRQAFVSRGSGVLDFSEELREIRPDILIVNEDGNTPDKQALCEELGIQYLILDRDPYRGLPRRSTIDLREVSRIPYRIDLAGGWSDQPFVSRHFPGSVITVSIEPTIEFNDRSGMATSTRRKAMELWGPCLPSDNYEKLAHMLFCCNNPPGTEEISGSQDAIGIVYPGLAKSDYAGQYWPIRITSVQDETALQFLEKTINLIPLGPRPGGFNVLGSKNITADGAQALAEATERCWSAIVNQDPVLLGAQVRLAFEAQVAMFPDMVTTEILDFIRKYEQQALGWKISGAGGGGYLILITENPLPHALRINVRREQ